MVRILPRGHLADASSELASLRRAKHTHTHTGEEAGQEGGGNLIYKSDTCPNNWVSTDLCLCY